MDYTLTIPMEMFVVSVAAQQFKLIIASKIPGSTPFFQTILTASFMQIEYKLKLKNDLKVFTLLN